MSNDGTYGIRGHEKQKVIKCPCLNIAWEWNLLSRFSQAMILADATRAACLASGWRSARLPQSPGPSVVGLETSHTDFQYHCRSRSLSQAGCVRMIQSVEVLTLLRGTTSCHAAPNTWSRKSPPAAGSCRSRSPQPQTSFILRIQHQNATSTRSARQQRGVTRDLRSSRDGLLPRPSAPRRREADRLKEKAPHLLVLLYVWPAKPADGKFAKITILFDHARARHSHTGSPRLSQQV